MNKNKIFDLHIGLSDAIVIMKNNPFISSKCVGDFPNQFDLFRANAGNLSSFISFMCPIKFINDKFVLPDDVFAEVNKHMRVLKKVQDYVEDNDIELKIHIGLEGLHFIKSEDDLIKLQSLIKNGVKYFGLKWEFESNLFKNSKLTELGIKTLKVFEKAGVVVDLAHSEEGLWIDILKHFRGRVIDSHTNCFSVNNHRRNASDEMIKEIIKRDGIIGMTFMSSLVGGSAIIHLIKHIEHFVDKFGADNLGIGSDFDGMKITSMISDLEDVSKYTNFRNNLKRIGIRSKDINNICFANANRFIR